MNNEEYPPTRVNEDQYKRMMSPEGRAEMREQWEKYQRYIKAQKEPNEKAIENSRIDQHE